MLVLCVRPSTCPSHHPPAQLCEHRFHYYPRHCGRLVSYLPSVGQRSVCAISCHSLIETQVLEVHWYTDHTVSAPKDKARCWRIGPQQSRQGHVDKGVTSSSGRYSVGWTLFGLRGNRYPPLPGRLCSYLVILQPTILLCSFVGTCPVKNRAHVFLWFLHKTKIVQLFTLCGSKLYLKPADPIWTQWSVPLIN